MWQHLIEVALLGSDKKTIDKSLIPNEIVESMTNNAVEQPLALLDAAAWCCMYLEAGAIPQCLSKKIENIEVVENKPTAPNDFYIVFTTPEQYNNKLKEKIYNVWLDSLIKNNYILDSQYILKLLQIGNTFSASTKAKILHVIGNKGRFVLHYLPELKYESTTSILDLWNTGTNQERKEVFKQMLINDYQNAIKSLSECWQQEPIVSKRAFLDILQQTPNPLLFAFATQLYENEFIFNAKERKTEKECRAVLASILLKFPESKLHQNTRDYLQKYLSVEKRKGLLGLVSSKQTIDFVIPATADTEFWNAETMDKLYGFDNKNYDAVAFKNDNLYWFSNLLALCPIEIWLTLGFQNILDIVKYFIDNPNFQYKESNTLKSMFLPALSNNAINLKNSELANILLNRLTIQEALPLLSNISIADYELYVENNALFDDVATLENNPYRGSQTWSVDFSQYIISEAHKQCLQNPNLVYKLRDLGTIIAQLYAFDAMPHLQTITSKGIGTQIFESWNTNIYEPIQKVNQIRNLLKTLK